MKYFIDTEFIEGPQVIRNMFGMKTGQTPRTIDLISIGIVAEDGREFYAVSKDFNIWEAWNRYEIEQASGDGRNIYPEGKKVYWIRENVLKPIFYDLTGKDIDFHNIDNRFTFKNLKTLIEKYGKSNQQIAKEVVEFTDPASDLYWAGCGWLTEEQKKKHNYDYSIMAPRPEFYAYYADYDWVVFCWLFGRMMDLPKGFPMYCKDLKQELDALALKFVMDSIPSVSFEDCLKNLKNRSDYPKQSNEHNALADAKWNFGLYKFLNAVKTCDHEYIAVSEYNGVQLRDTAKAKCRKCGHEPTPNQQ